MNRFPQNPRKNIQSGFTRDLMPANKRPRVGSSPGPSSNMNNHAEDDDDDDPFAEDFITGEELEEWDRVATQAEIKLTQEQSNDTHKDMNGDYKFKRPAMKIQSNGTNFKVEKYNDGLVKDLQKKLDLYETKMKEMERTYLRKDGETRVLRDRLSRAEKELNEEKVKCVELQKKHSDAEREQEKYVQKQVEKYKDQVEFKQAEILESQNLIRNLEVKNKMLMENKKSGSSTPPKQNKTNFPDVGWTSTQEGASAAKKIRLVKPESPRVQANISTANATFSDDPFSRKKTSKLLSKQPSTSKAEDNTKEGQKKNDQSLTMHRKLKMSSNYLSSNIHMGVLLSDLLRSCPDEPHSLKLRQVCDNRSPLFNLLGSENDTMLSNSPRVVAEEAIKKLLSAPKSNEKMFKNLTRCGTCNKDDTVDLLPLINAAVSSFVLLQESMMGTQSSGVESSYHTAYSCLPNSSTSQKNNGDTCIKCQKAYAALQVLQVITSYSQKCIDLIIQGSSNDILLNLIKLCQSERWNPRLEFCEDITASALCIISALAYETRTNLQLNQFSSLSKSEIWLPLVTSKNINIQCCAVDTLASLVYHQPFALMVVKDNKESDSASLLCHICDLCSLIQSQRYSERDCVQLQTKVINLLSILVSEHESLLMEHSAYSEIYHATDVLLYNELLIWKREVSVNQSRVSLIHHAICLLHSCANVYTDGIPGSRRDHRHQVVLTELEKFLARHGDKTSFWSQELNRIVKAEVKSLFEEVETT